MKKNNGSENEWKVRDSSRKRGQSREALRWCWCKGRRQFMHGGLFLNKVRNEVTIFTEGGNRIVAEGLRGVEMI